MPLNDLTCTKTKTGTIFACSNCQTPGVEAKGASDQRQLQYLLICPKCSRTLGEWVSAEQRDKELREFAAKLERPA
jgi:hypothetical protein